MYYSESEVEKAPALRAGSSYVMSAVKWFFNPLGLCQFFITLENIFALIYFCIVTAVEPESLSLWIGSLPSHETLWTYVAFTL
jgi:hypothetical protein